MTKDYEGLDAIVVAGALLIVAGVVGGLMFIAVPQNNLPVLASLGSTVLTLATAYAAFRWGNNVGSKQAAELAADTSNKATSALAQIAGAGPPPPAAPLDIPLSPNAGNQPASGAQNSQA
jgi:hypothetical protein